MTRAAARLCPALAALAMAAAMAAPASASKADDPMLGLLQARGLLAPAAVPGAIGAAAADASAELVLAAMNFLDVEYRFGGNDAATGFDCSGFTRHVFATAIGLALPRRAAEQAREPALHAVRREHLQPGDLVFFNTLRRAFSHVGLYIGDGRFVHAPRSGAMVRVESMRSAYWASRFDGARRVAALDTAPAAAGRAGLGAAPGAGAAAQAHEALGAPISPH